MRAYVRRSDAYVRVCVWLQGVARDTRRCIARNGLASPARESREDGNRGTANPGARVVRLRLVVSFDLLSSRIPFDGTTLHPTFKHVKGHGVCLCVVH